MENQQQIITKYGWRNSEDIQNKKYNYENLVSKQAKSPSKDRSKLISALSNLSLLNSKERKSKEKIMS